MVRTNTGENKMSTRARIGYKTRDNNNKYNGLVISTYVHMDGDMLLEPLNEVFFSKKKAFDLCFSGHISSLDLYINNGCVLTDDEKLLQGESILFTAIEEFTNSEIYSRETRRLESDLEYLYLYDKHENTHCWKQFRTEFNSEPVQETVPARTSIFRTDAIANQRRCEQLNSLYPSLTSILV